jgi:hypothetical protein
MVFPNYIYLLSSLPAPRARVGAPALTSGEESTGNKSEQDRKETGGATLSKRDNHVYWTILSNKEKVARRLPTILPDMRLSVLARSTRILQDQTTHIRPDYSLDRCVHLLD